MKKTLGCLALAFLTPVLLYVGWIQNPPSRHEVLSSQLLQASIARHVEEQSMVRSENNAYLDPDFLAYWGRKGSERSEGGEVEEKLGLMKELSDLQQGEEAHLEERWKQPDVGQAMAQVEQLYPKIHAMCIRPDFIVPRNEPPDLHSVEPNLLAWRRLPQDLSAYAEYLVLAGRSSDAIAVASDGLLFAARLGQQQPSIVRAMIGVAARSIAQETLAMVLSRCSPKESLAPVLDLLRSTQLPPTALVECLEEEYCQNVRSLSKLKTNPTPNSPFNYLSALPGLDGRELRMFKNDYLSMLQQVRLGQPVQLGWAANSSLGNWFLGRHSILAAILTPNLPRTGHAFKIVRLRQAFLHLYVSLLEFRRSKGHFPSSLQELSGYLPLDGLDLERVEYSRAGSGMKLGLTVSADEMPDTPPEPKSEMDEWNTLSGRNWKLQAR